jgi:thiamine-phosphate pyrophosphorylase
VVLVLPRIYPITDAQLTGLSHAEQVRRLASGGATFVQLREKQRNTAEFYSSAKAALAVARECGIKLIINDRVDIALTIGADGVHLGQDDLSPVEARKLLGSEKIIGCSTHNLAQAHEALSLPIDYLAIGPVFSTSTKADPDPIVGLEVVRKVRKVTGSLPIVAIGGINETNAAMVLAAGADSVAVISALLSNPSEISARTTALLQLF